MLPEQTNSHENDITSTSPSESPANRVDGDSITAQIGEGSHHITVGKSITQNHLQFNIHQTLSQADIQDENNRRILRQIVRKFWIKDVLEHSLNHEAAIRLNLADSSNLVEHRPWKIITQRAPIVSQLPAETHIIDVFDQMNERLLILGEPGAGKTTLLLELTRALLVRADEIPAYPSPVIFNLSSWAQRQSPIEQWLVDELHIRYSIPKKVAQFWVAQDKLLLLLDGLDEVQADYRAACAQAINQFHQAHLMPLVISCRVAEYENLNVRLKLQGAVLLQPFSIEQVNTYLNRAGPPLIALRSTLQQNPEFQELARSPLILSIMALAYQNSKPEELNLTNTTQTRHQHLFDTYIQRMFGRREFTPLYSSTQTVCYLHWLANALVQSGQTIFLIERMQPDWLTANKQTLSYFSLVMLLAGPIYGLIFGLIFGPISGLIYGLLYGLNGRPSFGVIDGLSVGLTFGLIAGLLYGLLYGLIDGLSGGFRKINPIEQLGMLRGKLKSSLYASLFWGLLYGLSGGLASWLSGGLSVGSWFVLNVGVAYGLSGGLIGGLIGGFREIELVSHLHWSWQLIKNNLYLGLSIGLIYGLIGAHSEDSALGGGLLSGLNSWGINALIHGLVYGLIGGLIFGLIFQPDTKINIPISVDTQVPNQGIRLSLRYSLVISLIFGAVFGLIGVQSAMPFSELDTGLRNELTGGLIGGLSSGGAVVIKHYILRLVLWSKKDIPWRYDRFLDYATALIFLRKVGGGYIFVHRLVMEHFAAMTDEDVERLSAMEK